MSQKFLFLHYGPGGNAQIEAKMLAAYSDRVDFWDQPKYAAEDSTSYEKLLESVYKKIQTDNVKNIIAHSFGANLLLDLLGKKQLELNKVILISPITNFPQGFKNFAKKLNLSTDFFALLEQKESISSIEFAEMLPHVLKIVSHAKFAESYWKDPQKYSEYTQIAQMVEPLNFSNWQSVLAQYLMLGHKYNELSLAITSKLVVLGSQDPYIEDTSLAQQFWMRLGFQVECLSDIGHYPHLENSELLNRIINTGH